MKAVILAGGGGTRLWPLSTPERPKQFQKLVSDKTMLEETISRLDFLKAEDIYIAINEKHLGLTRDLCPQILQENIIIEPALRDTSSCIGFAAAIIEKRHPGEVMAIIYADHLIKNKEEFQNKLQLAAKIAEEERTLNIVEVIAHEANPNYGYVKLGECLNQNEGIYKIDCFKEKPDLATAQQFVDSGNYLWNTGIYVWRSDVLLTKYKEYQPKTYKKLQTMANAYDSPEQEKIISEHYPNLEKISIDFAIMEKVDTEEIRILKADLGWSDVGTWEAIWEELSSSAEHNVKRGENSLIDCQGSLVYSDSNKKVAVIGLKDIVVVDTPEGLLVCQKKDSKRVKEI